MSRAPTLPPTHPALNSVLALLGMTVVHHAYGAWAYATPWRLHVVAVAAVAAAALLGLHAAHTRLSSSGGRALALGASTLLALGLVLWLGLFEGLYNHVLKDVLYLAGANPELLWRLFPPPTYAAPDDLLFELSGLLQVPFAAWVLVAQGRLLGSGRGATDALGSP